MESYRENSKMFWKEVNRVRKKKEEISGGVKGLDGEMVQEDKEVSERWREYFKDLLNVNGREREIGRWDSRVDRSVVNGGLEEVITKEEIKDALRKVKRGKSAGLDGVSGEMLKEGGDSMIEWLERLFMVCWRNGEVPQDWQDACVVPIYKGKGDKRDCGNYRELVC